MDRDAFLQQLQPVGVEQGKPVYNKPYIQYIDLWKKEIITLMVINQGTSAREIERQYRIPRSTIGDWVNAHRNRMSTFREQGNQRLLDTRLFTHSKLK
jgi:hypothetical protein